MKELKNFILFSLILLLPLYLDSTGIRLQKPSEITINPTNDYCFKNAVDKVTQHRLLIEKMWQEEIFQTNFKRDFYVILH
jgi:hypothetical protein